MKQELKDDESAIWDAVRRLKKNYRWALLSEEILVDLVRLSLSEWEKPPPKIGLNRLIRYLYTPILYDAFFRQNEYPDRYRQAYCELFHFLRRVACQEYPPEMVRAVTQTGLDLLLKQIDHCNRPVTFLTFAHCKLHQAFTNLTEQKNGNGLLRRQSPKVFMPDERSFQGSMSAGAIHGFPDSEPDRMIYDTVRRLKMDYNWALLSENVLVDLVSLSLSGSKRCSRRTGLKNLIRGVYIPILYDACSQDKYPSWRRQACHELTHFLYKTGPYTDQEVVETALGRIYEKICSSKGPRSPATFLPFAAYQLKAVCTELRRSEERQEKIRRELKASELKSPEDVVIQTERALVLREAVEQLFWSKKKCGPRQAQVIALTYYEGLNDKEISHCLSINLSTIPTLRRRGLACLREDKNLRDWMELRGR